jgi:hypothetical protein
VIILRYRFLVASLTTANSDFSGLHLLRGFLCVSRGIMIDIPECFKPTSDLFDLLYGIVSAPSISVWNHNVHSTHLIGSSFRSRASLLSPTPLFRGKGRELQMKCSHSLVRALDAANYIYPSDAGSDPSEQLPAKTT